MNVLQPLGAVGVVIAALALAACDDGAGDGQARRRAAAAAGDRGQPARDAGHRMVRVHGPVRGDRERRGAGAGLGLPRGDPVRGRRDRRAGPGAVRDRPAALSGRGGAAAGAAEQRRGPGRPRRCRAQARRAARQQREHLALDLRSAHAAKACRRGGAGDGGGRGARGRARSRVHRGARADHREDLRSPGRHRQPRDRRSGGDPAHHHRGARSDLLRVRHERGGLSRLPARGRGRRAVLGARSLDPGAAPPAGRAGHRDLAAQRLHGFRRQPDRPERRHDPRPRRARQSRSLHHARPVRPAAPAGLARATRRSWSPTARSWPIRPTRSS